MRPALALLLGCPGGPVPTDTDSDPDPAPFASLLLDGAPETGMLLSAWSRTEDELILVGGDFSGIGRIARYDGTGFCVEPEPVDAVLWWVHGRGPDDWYAVGERGAVLHVVDGVRAREDLPTESTLFGVYDDGADVWAVGGDVRNTQDGEIWRKPAGGAWERVLGPIEDGAMFKVWEGWFVGVGRAYRWDGASFVERPPPEAARLTTVRGDGPDHVWAVGGQIRPTLLEWDGSSWVDHPVAPACSGGQGLNGVWTAPGEDVWIAGNNGAAARYADGEFTCADLPITPHHFHAVTRHGGETIWVGGDFFEPSDNVGAVAVHPARAGGPLAVGVCTP